jgi:hypothetical protein
VAAPVALAAALLLHRPRWHALAFAAAYAASLAALLGTCRLVFGEAFFANTLFHGAVGGIEAMPALKEFAALVPLVPAIASVGYLVFCGKGGLRRRFLPLYVVTGSFIAATAFRSGGSRAYFFDLVTALALALGCAWPRIEAALDSPGSALGRRAKTLALFAAATLLALGTVSALNFTYDWVKLKGGWGEGRHAARREMFESDGMVLSTHAGYDVGTPGFNFTTDPHRLGQLLEMGVVSRETILKAVEAHAFSGVIMPAEGTRFGVFDEQLKSAVRRHYSYMKTVEKEEYYTVRMSRTLRPEAPERKR